MHRTDHQHEPLDPDLRKAELLPGEAGIDGPDKTSDPNEGEARPLYTGSGQGWSPLRVLLGVLALGTLIAMALSFSKVEHLQTSARVGPSQIFRIEEVGAARYQWTLYDGKTAGSPGVIGQQILRFDQSDIVDLDLPKSLTNGGEVQQGDPLVHFRSPANTRRLEELKAQRTELAAQRALLEAGRRPEAIEEARQRLQVAQARRTLDQAELLRLRELVEHGAASQADLQAAELQDTLRALQVSLEKASLELEAAPVRQEQLDELDARLSATSAGLTELEILLEGQTIYSQISGQVRMGGDSLVEVLSSETKIIHLPIPQAARYRTSLGDSVVFVSQMTGSPQYEGTLIDIADQPELIGAEYVFWAVAEISSTAELQIGMTGSARLKVAGEETGLLSDLRRQFLGH